ncbi:EAL domain-containing protein [Streptomyces sp. NPDC003090]|uniref:EAL domain-containing protein n=1 Tax=Streptomyces sp. NPDC003090 TaxID=3154274 RepID=UPI00380F9384
MQLAHRLTAGYIALVALCTAVYLALPAGRPFTWAAVGLLATAAVLTGVRVHRPGRRWPWFLSAAAVLLFSAGDTTYNVMESFLGADNPYPSPADLCYLLTYPLFAAALFGFVRYRRAGHDRASLLDALILTTGLSLLAWVYLVVPLAHVTGLTWQQRATSVAYPIGDVLLLAMLTTFLTTGTVRITAVRLIALATATLLVFDVMYAILQLNSAWETGTLLDLGWVVFYTGWGTAALSPSMAELTRRVPREPPAPPPPVRVYLLTGASLIAPVILLTAARRGTPDTALLSVFSAVLIVLVVARLGSGVLSHSKAVAREHGLHMAAGDLVTAVTPQDAAAALQRAVKGLTRREDRCEAVLLTVTESGALRSVRTPSQPYDWLLTPGDGATASTARGAPAGIPHPGLLPRQSALLPVRELGPPLDRDLAGLHWALLCPLAVPDSPLLPPADTAEAPPAQPHAGMLVVAGPEKQLAQVWHIVETLASLAALALERMGLSMEVGRRNSEAYFQTLVRNASDVILIVDDDDTIRYASPSAEVVFDRADLTGTPLLGLVSPRDRGRTARMLERTRAGGRDTYDTWRVLRDDDRRVDVEARCSDLRHDSTVRGLVLTLRDVTQQRQLEHELTRRAYHDPLTGLPNRQLLLERIERALVRGTREASVTCLLFIDLDDFKAVNDTMGHGVGDELLTALAARLDGALRSSDTAARLGGDEFAVLMEDAKSPVDGELMAAQLVRTLSRPFRLRDRTVTVSASVGLGTALDSGDAQELLSHADLALYAAKAAGKRQWRRFRPVLHAGAVARQELQSGLDRAIAEQRLALRYQPIVDLRRDTVVGFEALARWPHSRRGMVPPEQFIPLAEETGAIMPLGTWVLERATATAARWRDTLPDANGTPYISVNVSAWQFREPAFTEEVRAALDRSRLPAGALVLELTESVLMRPDRRLREVMRTLKDLGVGIAVDDFGTGFSSLSYLRDFPIDILKIDKSFIGDLAHDPRQESLVEGIVRLAATLGMEVIAEGIEAPRQRDLLRGMGCRFGQGYLFGRPMTVPQGAALLREGERT